MSNPASSATSPTVVPVVERIIPSVAKKYLAQNHSNRPIRQAVVDRYAGMMADGKWHLTHEGIAFGKDGKLYDGQHRLTAIIQSGVPVRLVVTRGLEPTSREDIDTGSRRTALDNLAIVSGVMLPKTIGAALNIIWMVTNTGTVARSASAGELQEMLKAHNEGVEMVREVFTGTRRGICRSSFLAAFLFAYPTDKKRIRALAERFYQGTNLTKGDPMYALREYALNSHTPSNRPEVILDFRRGLGMIQAALDGAQRNKVFAKTVDSIENSAIFIQFAQAHSPKA